MYKDESGVMLILILAFTSLLLLLGSTATTLTKTDIKISHNYRTSKQALCLAEAGLHKTIASLNSNTAWLDQLSDPTVNAFPNSSDSTYGEGQFSVQVFENDPSQYQIRVISTATINTNNSSATVEAVLTPDTYPVLDYGTITCGDFHIKNGQANEVTDANVFAQGDLHLNSSIQQTLRNSSALATGNILIDGTSSVVGGDAKANQAIDLQSSASPNVQGSALAGSNIQGSGQVAGSAQSNVSPSPVTDICLGPSLAKLIPTREDLDQLKNRPDTTTINGNYSISNAPIPYSGVVHITGNFSSYGNVTFTDNVVFIVDGTVKFHGNGGVQATSGNVAATFIVPNSHMHLEEEGNITLDGNLIMGTVNADGTLPIGGELHVKKDTSLLVNGTIFAKGDIHAEENGIYKVHHRNTLDQNLIKAGSYSIDSWKEVRN